MVPLETDQVVLLLVAAAVLGRAQLGIAAGVGQVVVVVLVEVALRRRFRWQDVTGIRRVDLGMFASARLPPERQFQLPQFLVGDRWRFRGGRVFLVQRFRHGGRHVGGTTVSRHRFRSTHVVVVIADLQFKCPTDQLER